MKIIKDWRAFKQYRKSMKEKASRENQLYFEHSLCRDVLQNMVDEVHMHPNVVIDVKLLSGETLRIHSPIVQTPINNVKRFYDQLGVE